MATLLPETSRTLQTAAAAVRVVKFIAEHPAGVRLEEVAVHVGKSKHTAYYLMNTLCQEGFAFQALDRSYRLTALAQALTPKPLFSLSIGELKEVALGLHASTLERTYLMVFEDGLLRLVGTWGKRGQPGPQGLGPVMRNELHALAIGKAALAAAPFDTFDTYTHAVGLKRFTPNTTCDPDALLLELQQVRIESVALEEEFAEGFCCLAIPARLDNGTLASLGMAVPTRRFMAKKAQLIQTFKHLYVKLSQKCTTQQKSSVGR